VDFSGIIQESRTVSAEGFMLTLKKTIEELGSEEGEIGNLAISDRFVRIKPAGEALVVGDLHGDIDSFGVILEKSGFLGKMAQSKGAVAVFLGDYGDRGAQSPELYYVLLKLKLAYPEQVVLLRGNHEGPSDLLASPHDLPVHLQRKFGKKWGLVYQKIRELFDFFCNAAYVEDRYLMVHGGLPVKIRSLEEIAKADKLHPEKTFLEELLWNDPDEQVQGAFPSARGAGNIFGKTVTQEVLAKFGVKILIRGHEPADEGFQINHGGKILTLFSRKGSPYFNRFAAYLQVPLAETFENATQLLPYMHQF
jgi:Calcineurin-like phosphoesterase